MARAWKFNDNVNTDEIIPGRPLKKHWWKQIKNYIGLKHNQVVRITECGY